MSNNELIKYENGLVQKAGNAISITSKLLQQSDPILIPYRKKDKWGYCTPDKKIVIECGYDFAYPFYQGVGCVKLNGKYGFIDNKGKEISACTHTLSLGYEYGDNNYRNIFIDGLASLNRNNKIGIINASGKVIVPFIYDFISKFSEELARVGFFLDQYNFNKKCGFINKSGDEVIPCIYLSVQPFSEGLACVEIEKNKCGFIDKSGKEVIPCIYDSGYSYSFSKGLVEVKLSGERILIDQNNNRVIRETIIPVGYEKFIELNDGRVIIKRPSYYITMEHKEDYKIIDKNGKEIIPSRIYWDICKPSEGLAEVVIFDRKGNSKRGFIDMSFNEVVPCVYSRVKPFSEGLACVTDNSGGVGFIDKTGNKIIPCIYYDARSFCNGFAKVRKSSDWRNSKYGFIDKAGKEVIPFIYDHVSAFDDNGLAYVGAYSATDSYRLWYSFDQPFTRELSNTKSGGFIDKRGTEYWED